jgi:hypothetical protein
VFFSGSSLLLLNILFDYVMTISQRIQEHEESLLSSAGNKPLSFGKLPNFGGIAVMQCKRYIDKGKPRKVIFKRFSLGKGAQYTLR